MGGGAWCPMGTTMGETSGVVLAGECDCAGSLGSTACTRGDDCNESAWDGGPGVSALDSILEPVCEAESTCDATSETCTDPASLADCAQVAERRHGDGADWMARRTSAHVGRSCGFSARRRPTSEARSGLVSAKRAGNRWARRSEKALARSMAEPKTVKSSNAMRPRGNMSHAMRTGAPPSCSGAAYDGVPAPTVLKPDAPGWSKSTIG
mmetsp:Transcript_42573/g.112065  ORF Transcript_42573/g.112065 Transcript_42573/m.112065 type:complete len:209 (-) Transcript_42573:20-646(-)